jgi:hypothetical protein
MKKEIVRASFPSLGRFVVFLLELGHLCLGHNGQKHMNSVGPALGMFSPTGRSLVDLGVRQTTQNNSAASTHLPQPPRGPTSFVDITARGHTASPRKPKKLHATVPGTENGQDAGDGDALPALGEPGRAQAQVVADKKLKDAAAQRETLERTEQEVHATSQNAIAMGDVRSQNVSHNGARKKSKRRGR